MDKARAGHRQSKFSATFETTPDNRHTTISNVITTHDGRHLQTITVAQTPYARQSATIDSRNRQSTNDTPTPITVSKKTPKTKCRHLKQLTFKETLMQVFIRVYRLEKQSVMLVFSTQPCEQLPLYLLSNSPPPPLSHLPPFPELCW
jgi:hypothetical protein